MKIIILESAFLKTILTVHAFENCFLNPAGHDTMQYSTIQYLFIVEKYEHRLCMAFDQQESFISLSLCQIEYKPWVTQFHLLKHICGHAFNKRCTSCLMLYDLQLDIWFWHCWPSGFTLTSGLLKSKGHFTADTCFD